MLLGPVFYIELLTLARRRRYFVMRFCYGALLLYLIWQNFTAYEWMPRFAVSSELTLQESAGLGRAIFYTFVAAQSIILLVITPTLTAGVVAEEKQRKTLHYMLASCLTSSEIVLGKLAARLIHIAVFLALGLPIIAMLGFVGGVDPNEVILFFTCCASTSFFLASVSITISVYAKKPRDAISRAYVLELFWLFAPSIIRFVFPVVGGPWLKIYEVVRPVNEWVGWSSPFFVLMQATSFGGGTRWLSSIFWMIGLQLLYGVGFAALAVFRLRPVYRNEGDKAKRLSRVFGQRGRWFFSRPACGDAPIYWKERYASGTTAFTKVTSAILAFLVLLLLGYVGYQFAEPVVREILVRGFLASVNSSEVLEFNGFVRVTATLTFIAWTLGTAAAAAYGLSGEREEDTWISLIATPLTSREIIGGKMFGAFWKTRWIGLLWLIVVVLGLALGAVHPLGALAGGAVAAVDLWFACALGTFFSLRAKNSSRSLVSTIATLLFLNGIYLLALIPFQIENSVTFLGVTPFVEAISLMSYEDVSQFWSPTHAYRAVQIDYLFAAVASIFAYSLIALALTTYLVVDFDDAIDRPRTLGGGRKPRMPARKPIAAAEAEV